MTRAALDSAGRVRRVRADPEPDGRIDPAAPLWEGTVTLPADRVSGQLRILITEAEHLATDTVAAYNYKIALEHNPDAPPGPRFVVEHGTYLPGTGRITLADAIVI